MSKASVLKTSRESSAKVENFRQALFREAENLFSTFIPQKILLLDELLRDDAFNVSDMASLKAPLDIPIPDPPTPEDEEMETDEKEEDEKKKKPPKCGFINGNDKIMALINRVRPEIVSFRETIINVSCWIQHLVPKIEDGNDFGVAIQEKILERIVAVKTKADGYQASLDKFFLDRGDCVAKASKERHVMDYRTSIAVKDEVMFSEIRNIILDICGYYAELYDIVSKNLEKVTNPKGEEKPPMY